MLAPVTEPPNVVLSSRFSPLENLNDGDDIELPHDLNQVGLESAKDDDGCRKVHQKDIKNL